MTQSQLFTRPHRLLLARFFSQGLVAPILVTLILSIVLGASTFHPLDDEPAESLGAIRVKGKREAVSVFRLANA